MVMNNRDSESDDIHVTLILYDVYWEHYHKK